MTKPEPQHGPINFRAKSSLYKDGFELYDEKDPERFFAIVWSLDRAKQIVRAVKNSYQKSQDTIKRLREALKKQLSKGAHGDAWRNQADKESMELIGEDKN